MKKLSRAVTSCLIANAVGLGGYLYFCSRLWVDMPDGLLDANDGPSAISWFLTALPLMVLCALFNIVVLVRAVRHIFIGKGWSLLSAWGVVVGAWVFSELYVRSHMAG